MSIDHERALRIANGWASSEVDYPPTGELARAYLDLNELKCELDGEDLLDLTAYRLDLAEAAMAEEPHHRALREMRQTNGGR